LPRGQETGLDEIEQPGVGNVATTGAQHQASCSQKVRMASVIRTPMKVPNKHHTKVQKNIVNHDC